MLVPTLCCLLEGKETPCTYIHRRIPVTKFRVTQCLPAVLLLLIRTTFHEEVARAERRQLKFYNSSVRTQAACTDKTSLLINFQLIK